MWEAVQKKDQEGRHQLSDVEGAGNIQRRHVESWRRESDLTDKIKLYEKPLKSREDERERERR